MEKETEITLISYSVKLPIFKNNNLLVSMDIDINNFLHARDKAIQITKDYKEAMNSYKGVQLTLNYSEKGKDGTTKLKSHNILTGKKMGTSKILPSLSLESEILLKANKEFPKMMTKHENEVYLTVNQCFTFLYYFTFSI